MAFVACGGNHTVALTSDGGVIVFGRNYSGELGTGNNANQPAPALHASDLLNGVCTASCAAALRMTTTTN